MSLGPGGSASGAFPQPAASDPRVPVILRMRRGAGWFLTIAILSGINSLLEIFGAKIRFIFGLGITQLLDAAVHAYALYMIWQGYAAARELVQMQQAAQPGLSQPTLP